MKFSGKLFILIMILNTAVFAQSKKAGINIGEEVKIQSKVLDETRSLYISFPSSYKDSEQKYPVLYLLDGDSYLRLAHGIVDYLSTVYDLIPEMIIVGIGNTDRMRDMTPSKQFSVPSSGGADKFHEFFKTELIPYINKTYPVTSFRVLLGHSLGGLFSMYSLVQNAGLFNSYIAVSPSINWNSFEILSSVKEFLGGRSALNGFLFMSMSTEGMGEGYAKLNEFYTDIKTGIPKNFKVECKHYPDENHLTTFVPAVSEALRILFKDWRVPEYEMRKGIEGLKSHFRSLRSKFGYEIPIPSNSINTCGNIAIHEKRYDDGVEIYEYYISKFPERAHGYLKLGEIYSLRKNKDRASRYLNKALQIDPENQRVKTLLENLNK